MKTITDVELLVSMYNTDTEIDERGEFALKVRDVLVQAFPGMGVDIDVQGGGTEFVFTEEENRLHAEKMYQQLKDRLDTSRYPICEELKQAVLARKCKFSTAHSIAIRLAPDQQMAFIKAVSKAVSKEGFTTALDVLKLAQGS